MYIIYRQAHTQSYQRAPISYILKIYRVAVRVWYLCPMSMSMLHSLCISMPTTYVLTDHDMATLDMVDALDSYTPKIRDMAYTCNKK